MTAPAAAAHAHTCRMWDKHKAAWGPWCGGTTLRQHASLGPSTQTRHPTPRPLTAGANARPAPLPPPLAFVPLTLQSPRLQLRREGDAVIPASQDLRGPPEGGQTHRRACKQLLQGHGRLLRPGAGRAGWDVFSVLHCKLRASPGPWGLFSCAPRADLASRAPSSACAIALPDHLCRALSLLRTITATCLHPTSFLSPSFLFLVAWTASHCCTRSGCAKLHAFEFPVARSRCRRA